MNHDELVARICDLHRLHFCYDSSDLQSISNRALVLCLQVSQVPHEEVPEEAQRAGLAAGDCIQQGQEVGQSCGRCDIVVCSS